MSPHQTMSASPHARMPYLRTYHLTCGRSKTDMPKPALRISCGLQKKKKKRTKNGWSKFGVTVGILRAQLVAERTRRRLIQQKKQQERNQPPVAMKVSILKYYTVYKISTLYPHKHVVYFFANQSSLFCSSWCLPWRLPWCWEWRPQTQNRLEALGQMELP